MTKLGEMLKEEPSRQEPVVEGGVSLGGRGRWSFTSAVVWCGNWTFTTAVDGTKKKKKKNEREKYQCLKLVDVNDGLPPPPLLHEYSVVEAAPVVFQWRIHHRAAPPLLPCREFRPVVHLGAAVWLQAVSFR